MAPYFTMKRTEMARVCIRCARPARAEHHHREGPGPVGKGMGGTHEHLPEVPLCRECHGSVHRNEWAFSINGDYYVGTRGGDFRSPIKRTDAGPVESMSEEALRGCWHQFEDRAADLLRGQCAIAWILKERFGWMPEWWVHAAELLSLDAERRVWPQRVYERCKMWELVELRLGGERWPAAQLIGVRALGKIAKAEDPDAAFNEAVDMRLGGASQSETAGRFSDDREEEWCVCPCGHRHKRREA